jgi:hypothetical protein
MAFHPKIVKMEAYYRCQMARSKALAFSQRPKEAAANVTPEKTFKFAEKPPEEKNVLSKPCAGHLGNQLGAVKYDGRHANAYMKRDAHFGTSPSLGKTARGSMISSLRCRRQHRPTCGRRSDQRSDSHLRPRLEVS